MSGDRELLRVLAQETWPPDDALVRVHERVLDTVLDRPVTGLLRELPDVPQVRPVRAGSRLRRAEEPPARWPWFAVPIGLAAVAAVVLWVSTGSPGGVEPGAPPVPQVAALISLEAEATLAPSEHVALVFQGDGAVRQDGDRVAITWEVGKLQATVTPDQGVDLVVTTPDATVRVVGTVFEVERTRLGTQVGVTQGQVSVVCGSQAEVLVPAGDQVHCVPTTAIGLLSRAGALLERGATPDEVLATADAGLAVATRGDAVWSELESLAIRSLEEAGRSSEALARAEAFLRAGPSTREEQTRLFAARRAFLEGGCERADEHLVWLRAQGVHDDVLERCPEDP